MAEEELLKADSKGDNQEAELLILDEFAVLCRDLYAFYPMLIRYVDNNRYNTYPYQSYVHLCKPKSVQSLLCKVINS